MFGFVNIVGATLRETTRGSAASRQAARPVQAAKTKK